MRTNLKSATIGFAVGLAIATAAAQAAQHNEHSAAHPQHQPAQKSSTDEGRMTGDPAMHQQMMERMRQCRDTMSHMIETMDRMHGEQPRP